MHIREKAGFGVEPNSTLAQCTQRVCSPRGARLPIPAARLFYFDHNVLAVFIAILQRAAASSELPAAAAALQRATA